MHKPPLCQQCPMYGNGDGYVPDEIRDGELFVMLGSPDTQDILEARPATGGYEQALDTLYIPMTGLTRGENISIGHVIKCGWKNPYTGTIGHLLPSQTGMGGGKDAKKQGIITEKHAADYCLNAHTLVPPHVKVIIACGDLPWSSLGQSGTVDTWRGFTGEKKWRGLPVFATFSPSQTKHQPRMSIPVLHDWKRVKEVLNGNWPQPVPARTTCPAPRMEAPDTTYCITLDTEFTRNTYEMTLLGIAYWNKEGVCLGGDQIWAKQIELGMFKERLRRVISKYPTVMHNAIADLTCLNVSYGIQPADYVKVEDTIQLHALWQSEWPHDLGFLESMFSPHPKMKHLSGEAHALYNWGDCLSTGYAFFGMMKTMAKDPLSLHVYETQNLPLITVRYQAKQRGIPLDRMFLSELSKTLKARIDVAQLIAEGFTGFPINVGSDVQVGQWLMKIEKMKLKVKRGATRETVDKDMVASLRRHYYDFDPDAERGGIDEETVYANIDAGAHPLLEARAMYQSAATLYATWILPFAVIPGHVPTEPKDFINWVSADQSTHSQASGRWSITHPALTTLTYRLRKMLIPPEGYCMVKYDADQQELRLNAHLAMDLPTLEAFANGWDVHTLNVCDIFNIPVPPDKGDPHYGDASVAWRHTYHWEGKDDKRRVFGKRFVYRLIYRGSALTAGDIPGARALNLTRGPLVEASHNYLRRHPALPVYWAKGDAEIRRTRTVRSFSGRKRFLNGDATIKPGQVSAICREGTNHKMQSGGVDWSNINILTIRKECEDLGVEFVYGSFDSHNWFVPLGREEAFRARVVEITNRPWNIEGRELVLPITLDPTMYRPEGEC